jgi:N-acetyl-anhydromuramyl-L-alanine amidase AmpD
MNQLNQPLSHLPMEKTHQKNKLLLPGQGYSLRRGSEPYKTFTVHTTNGSAGSRGESELKYIAHSPNISAHYFIDKQGIIHQVLDPAHFVAWHAGEVSKDSYSNYYAVGVEMHFSPKELYWTGEMWASLTKLARCYSSLERVTHRQIARPAGRKIDPSGVTDSQFVNWSASLNKQYVLAKLRVNTNVRSSPVFGVNIIGVLPADLTVVVEKQPVPGGVYNSSNLWYYCNWVGYVHSSLVDVGGDI